MIFPVTYLRPQVPAEPPAMVRTVGREDVLWNRPVFKAPRLELHLKQLDAERLAEDLRQISRFRR